MCSQELEGSELDGVSLVQYKGQNYKYGLLQWAITNCHDCVTPSDSARPLVGCRLKSNHDRTPPTLHIHLPSDN